MYLSYYNLKAKPFQMSTDPEFLWLGEKHKEALAVLKYAVLENKGVLALTGDVGTGKTTLINALLRSLGADTITATIYDPRLEVLDFFNTVAAAFEMGEIFEHKGKFILRFKDFLTRAHKQKKSVLLIIDEAQGINEDLLEEIRLLSNLEANYTRLLNIFFVGQNEFVDILQKYENRALRQRVTIRYHIEPLTLNETAAYINYRLKVGGTDVLIFDSGAIDEIFIFSDGYPRLINVMCDHALLSGYVREVQVIKADLIRECREELLVSKKSHKKDFEYFRDVHQSLPNHTMVTGSPDDPFIPVEDSNSYSEPPPDSFTPVEDSHSYEDEQMVFSSWQPKSEREEPRKSSKKRFFRSPITIAFLLLVGLAAGFYFYYSDNNYAESFVSLAKKQTKKYVSAMAGSKNNKPQTAPVRPETSDSPSRVEAGKVGDSRFFMAKSPNSDLLRETISKEAETSQNIPSKRVPEEKEVQTYATPRGLESDGNNKTMEANNAGVSNVSPESSLESESPKGIAPVTTKSVDTVSSNPRQKLPVMVPITEKAPDKIQTLPLKPDQVHSNPKTPEMTTTKAVEPIEKPETDKSVSKPGQKPESPKNTEMKKGPSVASSVSSKEQATTIAAVPLVNLPKKTVVSKTEQPVVNKSEAKEKSQPKIPASEGKKTENRGGEKIVSSIDAMSKPETEKKVIYITGDLQTRVKTFLTRYCRTYAQKDLDKFSTFFAPNALENGIPFRYWLSQYRKNFAQIDSIEYDIELQRYATQEETGLVRIDGVFHVRAKLNDSKEWRKKSGQVFMVLEADGNSFKVKQLDY